MNRRENTVLANIMRNISKTYLLGIFYLVASVSFADEYKVNVPLWKGDPIPMTVEFNISSVNPGEILELDYVGLSVWIYRRTDEEIRYIADNYSGATPEVVDGIIDRIMRDVGSVNGLGRARRQLLDQPELEKNPYRSKHKEYLVFEAIGRLGCKLQMELPVDAGIPGDAKFYDPCTYATYNLAGRFIGGYANGSNGVIADYDSTGEPIVPELELRPHTRIPPHQYISDDILSIGVSDLDVLPQLSLSEDSLFSGLTPTELLLQATAFNDLSRARAALKAGANVNAPGVFRKTTGSLPLYRAVVSSSVEMVELLILHGATPGEDEIDAAVNNNRRDVSRLLEEASNQ